jgi:glycosyl transferase family 1
MKVLFVDHPEADFLSGVLYMGLKEILGEDVIDYPFKRSFHGETHEYPSCYESGSGTSPWHSWRRGDDGRAVGTTSPFAWMPSLPGRAWTEDEVIDALWKKEFDLVILASPRTYNIKDLRELVRKTGRSAMPPIVFVDGEDYSTFRWDIVDEFRPCVYLKRELLALPNDGRVRIEPFPFASPVPVTPAKEKDIDVLFLGGGTWGERNMACDVLKNTFGDRFVGGVGVQFGYNEYLDAINRSRIAISVRGWGFDTLRYWEIPSFETLLVADSIPIIKPHPFEQSRTCVYFSSPQDLITAVRCFLEDEQSRVNIARAGNEHLRKYHTARARAQQLLDHGLKG